MNPIKPIHPSTSFFLLLRRRLHESTMGSMSPTPPLGYRVLLLTSTTIPTITLFIFLLKHRDLLVTITRKCRMQLRNLQSLIPLPTTLSSFSRQLIFLNITKSNVNLYILKKKKISFRLYIRCLDDSNELKFLKSNDYRTSWHNFTLKN